MANAPAGQVLEKMQNDFKLANIHVDKATAALTKAVEDNKSLTGNRNEDFIHAGITQVNAARELVSGALEKVGVARASAIAAGYDKPSVKEHKDGILATIELTATWKKDLQKLDTTAEKLVEALFAKLDNMTDASSQCVELVGQMSKILSGLTPDQAGVRTALDTYHANALKAVERRSANSLELAKSDADEVNTKRFEDGLAKVTPLRKKADEAYGNLDGDTRMKQMSEYGRVRHAHEKLEEDVPYFKARKQAIKAMKVVPLDIAKALKTLDVPAKHKDALAKALEAGDESRCTKALDDLAKQAKLSESGKDMYAALKKAKVV